MRTYLLLSLLLLSTSVLGQVRKKKSKLPFEHPSVGYKDFVVLDSTIWALDENGLLMSLTSKGEELPFKADIKGPVTSIHRTNPGGLVAVCGSVVYLVNTNNGSITLLSQLPAKATFLTIDSQQRLWAATETGLLNVTTNKHFAPSISLNSYYKWQPTPNASLLDSNNVLWLGFDRGEWGGNMYAFDTNKQTFIPIAFPDTLACLPPINSFCQIGSQIYLAGVSAHGYSSSCITRLEGFQARHVFSSNWKKNYRTLIFGDPDGEYIRAFAYNPAEQCCYYYSQNGIFKGSVTAELDKASAWQLVWAPAWPGKSNRHEESKMAFTSDNKLVLLVRNGAIGIWDGRVFRLVS